MITSKTVDQTDIRLINRSAILELLRRNSPLSRNDVAKILHISLPTVSRIIDDLIEDGLVCIEGEKEWSGGRRRSRLRFCGERQAILALDLSGTRLGGAVLTMQEELLQEQTIDFVEVSGERHLQRISELVDRLIRSTDLSGRTLRGIGLGIPGAVQDTPDGPVVWAPRLKWKDFPLKQCLESQFSLPVLIENDVNLAAIGEFWFGAGQQVRNMVLLSIGAGIGAGIILDGALYRGSHHFAGEAGYILPGAQFLTGEHVEYGALESLASEGGLLQRSRRALQGQVSADRLLQLQVDDVFQAYLQGEIWPGPILDETYDLLAIAVGNIAVLLDPEVIVLGGSSSRYADLLIPPILERLEKALPIRPRLVSSTLKTNPVYLGAAAVVLHYTTGFSVMRRLT